jgi:hypothetical protein
MWGIKGLLVLLVLTLSFTAEGQLFNRFYGDASHRQLNTIIPYSDGYIIAGVNFNSNTYRPLEILWMDSCLQIKKGLRYGLQNLTSLMNGNSIALTQDSGIIAAGTNVIDSSSYVMRTDKTGKILWSVKYEGSGTWGENIYETANGDIVGSGRGKGVSAAGIWRLTSKGKMLWSKEIIGGYKTYIGHIIAAKDGGTLVSGQFLEKWNSPAGTFVLKIDASGKIAWKTSFADTLFTNLTLPITELGDGSIILTGFNYNSFGKIIIAKLNSNGGPAWVKAVNTGSIFLFLPTNSLRMGDKIYMLGALTSSNTDGGLFEMDTSGKILWAKRYGDANTQDYLTDIKPAHDGSGLLLGGWRNLKDNMRNPGYWLMHVDFDGRSGCTESNLVFTSISRPYKLGGTLKDEPGGTFVPVTIPVQPFTLKGENVCKSFTIPDASLGPDKFYCAQDSFYIDLRKENPVSRFLWSTGDTTGHITLKKSGTYWVRVNTATCVDSDTIRLTFHPKKFVSLAKDTFSVCPHKSVKLYMPDTAYKYSWVTPSKDTIKGSSLTASDTGMYTVLAVSKTGCTDKDSMYVKWYPLPKAEAGPDTAICFGSSVYLQGEGGVTYLWRPAKYLNDSTLKKPRANPPGTQLYQLITANTFGCSDTDFVLLKVKPPLSARLLIPKNICEGEDVNLTAY